MKATFNRLATALGKLGSPTLKVMAGTALALGAPTALISVGGAFLATAGIASAVSAVRNNTENRHSSKLEIIANTAIGAGAFIMVGNEAYSSMGNTAGAFLLGVANLAFQLPANFRKRYDPTLSDESHATLSGIGGGVALVGGLCMGDMAVTGAGAAMLAESWVRPENQPVFTPKI